MKKIVLVLTNLGLSFLFVSTNGFAQSGDLINIDSKDTGSNGIEKNGDELIAQSFTFTECGLDYVFAANKVTDRVSYPTGTGLPSGLSISGIPAGATIVKALLYWAITVDITGTPNFSINGQAGIADLIGTGTEKCWYGSTLYNDPNYTVTDLVTQNYRADVTSMVTGNGVYSVDLTDWSRLVDGLGIIVVYKQTNQAWEGTLVIKDGCNTLDHYNNLNEFLPTVSPCVDACNVKTFSIVSDFATQSGDMNHFYSFAGGALISKNDLFFQIDEFINPFPLTAGTQTIAYNIKSDMYIASTDCFNLEANGLYFRTYSCTSCADNFQPTIAVEEASCGQCDGSATITANGGSAPFSVSWNPGVASGTNLMTVSNLCEGDYSVQLSDNSGCITFIDSFYVSGTPAFVVDSVLFQETNCTICNGVIEVVITNPPSNLNYTLTLNGSTLVTQTNNGYFGSLCAGTYELAVLDSSGCSYNQTIVINQLSNIVIDSVVTAADNGCIGNCNGIISVFPNSGLEYSIDGGATWQNSSIFNQVCSANYTVIIQDNLGCTNQQIINISFSPLQISGGSDVTLCENGSSTLNVTASGGQVPYTYNWSPNIGNVASISVSPSANQQYTVSVVDGLGCQSSDVVFNVTLLSPITLSDINDLNYCEGNSMVLNSTVVGGNGNYTYQWIDSSSQLILGQNSSLNFSLGGTGTVFLIVEDDCSSTPDTISFTYLEENQPTINLVSSNLTGCPPFSTSLSILNSPSSSNFIWNIGGEIINSPLLNLDYTTSAIGCQDINLILQSAAGCTFSYLFDQVFCVSPLPTATFNYNPIELTTLNSSFNLINTSDLSFIPHWSISSNATISDVNVNFPIVTYALNAADSIDVCLEVVDTFGCTANVCETIPISNEFLLYVPNSFTPDGDSFNQEFMPVTNIDIDDTYQFLIFNRWGTQIFETTDPLKGWDGTYLGKNAQEGTYTWKIIMTKNSNSDGNQLFVGHVNLLK
jgi:gliding motility-associated-like protein